MATRAAGEPRSRRHGPAAAEPAVTTLYHAHALGLIRLAHILGPYPLMLQGPAELTWKAHNRHLLALVLGRARLLDTASRGHDLLSAQRVLTDAQSIPGFQNYKQFAITPDGRHILVAFNVEKGNRKNAELAEFSASNGKLVRILRSTPNLPNGNTAENLVVSWTSPSGKALVVTWVSWHTQPGGPGSIPATLTVGVRAGVLANGHYTALPWPAGTRTAAW